jgi:branched-chain amino acid transport system ATP-binding protein
MLKVEGATVTISGFTILRGVSLEVPGGAVVGLIGRNGAGKTTTLRSIMGLVELDSGRIELDGRDLTRLAPHRRAELGIGYMPEDRRLVPTLTVEENILIPAWARRIDPRRLQTIYELIPEVRELRHRPGTQLSGGQQKLVALARAFMSGSSLLLLDEPFEGVAPSLVHRLVRAVRDLCQADHGVSALLCESEFKWPRLLAQDLYVIERGETTKEEPTRALA